MGLDWYPPECQASAPGSLMLMGEHAVLRGKPALVFAIDKRIQATLKPRRDDKIFIESQLGRYTGSLNTLTIQEPFSFVLAAIDACRSELSTGFELTIHSPFSHQLGFGSSAAVVVATLKSFEKILGRCWTLDALFQTAKSVVRRVQGGVGSGSDVAASVYGGLVFYQPEREVQKLAVFPPFVVLYSGYKTPTREVIQQVNERSDHYPALFDFLFQTIEICTIQGRIALEKEDWSQVGDLMNIHQGLQVAMGVSNVALDQLVDTLKNTSGIYGAKISGSGLGDCVIGLGVARGGEKGDVLPGDVIPIQVSLQGVMGE